ncbi:hypothetical protein CORC01_01861 [Colletotrichum orchidophilum]|uniref:Uncharacterized protein n=1 Tax=Colletotrichum orchidophilum TaxID=1209926 RepID=A0A1G4BMR9_9PEZI|nr:uncharacterized protein CORC01_01861 [Colletotrichum orchidophilum]OHF02760.1 hypothetical protein CORC01_01861 [Colletotrichum orchidophilum]
MNQALSPLPSLSNRRSIRGVYMQLGWRAHSNMQHMQAAQRMAWHRVASHQPSTLKCAKLKPMWPF